MKKILWLVIAIFSAGSAVIMASPYQYQQPVNLASIGNQLTNQIDDEIGEFKQPWKDESAAIVIDTFEGNAIDWQQLATDERVAGIIRRATKGNKIDAKYFDRRAQALKMGYKWGSYHIGVRGNPIKQADYYLKTVKPKKDELLALDLEDINSRKYMNIAQAKLFIKRIKEKTGRYPMIYGNYKVIAKVSEEIGQDNLFAHTPLWLARFRSDLPDFPQGTWDHYTLWQFSCEINCHPGKLDQCLYLVPGTPSDMDINVYHGSIAELKANWPFGK